MKTLFNFIEFIIIFSGFSAFSQELPPVANFGASDYNAGSQNWSITQDSDKIIYVANNKGLLQFNGSKWKLYASPNETILRSVKAIDKRIYSGSFMDFGYWEYNTKGDLEYTSIVNKKTLHLVEDEQIWKILSHNDWVLFQSLHSMYVYNPADESLRTIHSKSPITKSFIVNNEHVFFQSIQKGLFEVFNGEAKLVSDQNLFKNETIINAFTSYDNKNEIIIHTQNKGFYKWDTSNNNIKEWKIFDNENFENATFYNSAQLKNGDFVLGSIANGVFVVDKNGQFLYHMDQSNGLLNNTILTVFEDIDNNIWLGLDNGINCINHTSSIKIFNDDKGKLGTVYTSILHKGNLYLGTNQGLFFKDYSHKNSHFKFIEDTQGQVWSLQLIDDTLFCGHNNGTFVIENEKAEQIISVPGTWILKSINTSANKIIQGNYDGLYILKKENNHWGLDYKIKGFDISSRYFEVFGDTVFVNHEYKGIYTLKMNKVFTNVENVEVNTDLKGKNSCLLTYENKLLYAYKKGVFNYNFITNKFVKDSILSQFYVEENYDTGKLIHNKKDNILWGFNNENFVYLSPGKLSKNPEIASFTIPSALEKSMSGFENILPLESNNYLYGNSSGYYIFDINTNEDINGNKLLLSTVVINDKENNFQKIARNENIELSNRFNSINFHFSVPYYNAFKNILYQYKLSGYKNEWTSWSKEANANFENLPAGDYKLHVKAKIDGNVLQSSIERDFVINKKWYLSNTAIALYILSLGVLLFFLNNYYQSFYEKQEAKKLAKIKNELILKELENNKQLIELENQKLVQDIENKNRELAISTMSLVKKNEFLNNIKKELLSTNENNDVKAVVKIIDKNINTTNDWKFFQQAFDNADKDFLKKVKAKHNSLTPNDLKLCAYLRLNLSSKEIAPLLNISPRSVEVKRYRLRKKMELPHETSLTNYILEI